MSIETFTQRAEVRDAAEFGRVAVMYGGISSEREISLQTGEAVLEALLSLNVNACAWDPAVNSLSDFAASGFDRVWIASGNLPLRMSRRFAGSRHTA